MNLFAKKAGYIVRPKPRLVHGIEVKKQPTLAYIEATERTAGLMMELLDNAFPGMTPGQVIDYLTGISTAELKELGGRLLSALPRTALGVLREIVGAQDNPVWEQLTPFEHSEVIKAFWELNDLSAFFMNARNVMVRSLPDRTSTGLNG